MKYFAQYDFIILVCTLEICILPHHAAIAQVDKALVPPDIFRVRALYFLFYLLFQDYHLR